MEALFIYLIKSAILLSVIAIVYHLFLRQTTFLYLNRAYLLLGVLASFTLPLIHYTYDVVVTVSTPNIQIGTPSIQEQLSAAEQLTETAGNPIDIFTILFIVYIAGVVLYLFKILSACKKINKLVKRGLIERKEGYKIVITKDIESPCSILNNILINTDNLSDMEREAILRHEITHIKQRHWIDLLCSECMLLLQWFNPMARFYISLLKENHEFLADKAVVRSGISPALYKAVLLNQQFNRPVFSFANSFNYSNKSKRLIMVTKEKSSVWKKMLILILIPIFTIQIWATAEPNYIIEQQPTRQLSSEQISQESVDTVAPESTVPQDKEPIPLMVVQVKPKFNDSEEPNVFREWVQNNLIYPQAAIDKNIQGRVTVEFVIDKTGSVKDVTVLREADPILEAEAVRVISSSPKWTPGKHREKTVDVVYVFPVVFSLK